MKIVHWGDAPKESWRPGNETRLHAAGSSGTERLCVGEQWFEPGVGAPTHFHPEDVEEVVSVVSGAADFHLDGEHQILRAGNAVIIPGGSVHGFVAIGDEPLHIYGAFSSPSPPTTFVDAPDQVILIGGTQGQRLDTTRTRQGS